jgi:hypothetical protein
MASSLAVNCLAKRQARPGLAAAGAMPHAVLGCCETAPALMAKYYAPRGKIQAPRGKGTYQFCTHEKGPSIEGPWRETSIGAPARRMRAAITSCLP